MPSYISIVLFLVGSTWWIELGGLDSEQLHHFKATLNQTQTHVHPSTKESWAGYTLRLKVDTPNSEKAPPLGVVIPFLNILSSMGYSLLSHNDEYRANKDMVYLTWMLQRDDQSNESPFAEQ